MTARRLHLTSAADLEARRVSWLVADLIPLGKVTVLAGAPGLGKSLYTAHLAAAASTGSAPGDLLHRVSDVLIVSAEDDPEDTIKPRLLAAEAACDRVHVVDVREIDAHGAAVPTIVQLPGDVAQLHDHVVRLDARLVVLDPVAALLDGDYSAYREQDVRAALAPLKLMAEETGCAVVLVMHVNKAEGSDPLRRIGNSGAFTALARSVLLLGPDPEDEEDDRGDRRVLTVVKGNVRHTGTDGLALRIASSTITGADGEEIEAAAIEVTGRANVAAADLLDGRAERGKLGEAIRWLRNLLTDGPMPSKAVEDAAKKSDDVAWRTVKRAKRPARVESRKLGPESGWVWVLQDDPVAVAPGDDGDAGTVGPLPATSNEEVGTLPTPDGTLRSEVLKDAKGAKEPTVPAPDDDPAERLLVDILGSDDAVVDLYKQEFDAEELSDVEAA